MSKGNSQKEGLAQMTSKFKSGDQYMQEMMKNFSPFKMGSEMERVGNMGVSSFLPSYHEHKLSLIRGHSSKKGDFINESKQQDEDEEYDRKKSYKRSGTTLLGNIKDPSSNKNLAPGVVPKDLGLGLIKDLIDFEDMEFDHDDV